MSSRCMNLGSAVNILAAQLRRKRMFIVDDREDLLNRLWENAMLWHELSLAILVDRS